MGLSTHMSFIWRFYKFDCQSLNRVRFGAIADLDCYLHQSFCLGLSQSLMGMGNIGLQVLNCSIL